MIAGALERGYRMLTCPSCGRANPDEASFCMGCAAPLGATATAHETRKTVTALFCDLVGSTTLGERHDPEVLRPLLDSYFAAMREAAERHGGRVEKFIGDAVSAVFGLPAAHEDDALRAVRAGVEMQSRLALLNEGSVIQLAARIGITTGEVLVPGSGAPLIGDAMNTASRLQSTAEPGSVVIGEPTFRLVRDAVTAELLPPLAAKGKPEPVPAYRVLRVASGSPTRARRMDAPMVGRAREAAALRNAFERAASDRTCELFTVLGVAGAGKSRLVEEFLATLDSEVEVLRGCCLPYGDGITYLPVAEALRGALGLPEFAEVADVRAAIAAAVAGEEHAVALESSLLPLFAAGSPGAPEETAWAVRRLLESRGRERPVVLVLDDIHWGEEAFLDLVEHLADWSRDASILLLAMARPDLLDVRPAWGGGKTNAATISLPPLTAAETDALVDGLLGSASLPEALHARVRSVAEGNPLFTEELLRLLVDEGRLVRDEAGAWAASGDLAAVPVPPTVSALLSARIDRLSDGERAVLEAASVEGQSFHAGAVAALLPEAEQRDLPARLRSLVRKELVVPERSDIPGQDAYRFRHILIRDAAYDAIPKAARSRLHVAFADWLEGTAGDRVSEQQAILGYHLERAHRYREELGLPENRELRLRAGRALSAAGSRALDAGDDRGAIQLLHSAVKLSAGDSAELEALDSLRQALWESGQLEAAVETARRVEAAANRAGDASFAMWARAVRGDEWLMLHPDEADVEAQDLLLREALEDCRTNGWARWEQPLLALLAGSEWSMGRAQAMLERATDGLRLGRTGRVVHLETCTMYAIMAQMFGAYPLSKVVSVVARLERDFAWSRRALARIASQRAHLEAWRGRLDEARRHAQAGRAIHEDLGQEWEAPFYLAFEGRLAWWEGDYATAEMRLRGGLGQLAERADRTNAGLIAVDLARLLLEQGREREVDAALDIVRPTMAALPQSRIHVAGIAAVVAARRGDAPEALRLAEEARRLAAATDFLVDQGETALDRAEVLLLAGRPDEARTAAEDALARFERKEFAIGINRARAFLAALPA